MDYTDFPHLIEQSTECLLVFIHGSLQQRYNNFMKSTGFRVNLCKMFSLNCFDKFAVYIFSSL